MASSPLHRSHASVMQKMSRIDGRAFFFCANRICVEDGNSKIRWFADTVGCMQKHRSQVVKVYVMTGFWSSWGGDSRRRVVDDGDLPLFTPLSSTTLFPRQADTNTKVCEARGHGKVKGRRLDRT